MVVHHQANVRSIIWWKATRRALAFALVSALMSGGFFYLDHEVSPGILEENLPEQIVFNVFIIFSSLTLSFRTGHALSRYTDAAAYVHKISACWFDSASTLCSFLRASKASPHLVDRFQHTLIRLTSLLCALCLDYLQGYDGNCIEERLDVFSLTDFDDVTAAAIVTSHHKVEFVFQQIQQLVVDNMDNGVLCIAPPILTRAFHELGNGLLNFHEAKKLACVPLPVAYNLISVTIIGCQSVFVPVMLATFCKGMPSTMFFTFCGMFLTWFLHGIAESLSNPFEREAHTLLMPAVQEEFNAHMVQLILQAKLVPSVNMATAHTFQRGGALEPAKRFTRTTLRHDSSTVANMGTDSMGVKRATGAGASKRPWRDPAAELPKSVSLPRDSSLSLPESLGGDADGGGELERALVTLQESHPMPVRGRTGAQWKPRLRSMDTCDNLLRFNAAGSQGRSMRGAVTAVRSDGLDADSGSEVDEDDDVADEDEELEEAPSGRRAPAPAAARSPPSSVRPQGQAWEPVREPRERVSRLPLSGGLHRVPAHVARSTSDGASHDEVSRKVTAALRTATFGGVELPPAPLPPKGRPRHSADASEPEPAPPPPGEPPKSLTPEGCSQGATTATTAGRDGSRTSNESFDSQRRAHPPGLMLG